MITDDKEKILREIFNAFEKLDESDRMAVLGYIQGTVDTRERINIEKSKIISSIIQS